MAKLRVLCLHGFRASGSILQKQIGAWNASVIEKFDMSFLDGPFPDQGESSHQAEFPPPYYEWFQFGKDFTEFSNLDKCFAYIVDYMESHGPFDGLLGFSQGAVLSAALVGFQLKKIMLTDHPPIRFIISISGGKFGDPSLCALAYAKIINCPSIHIIGEKDWSRPHSEELLEIFKNPVVIRHPLGHTVPTLDGEAANIVISFLDGLEAKETACK